MSAVNALRDVLAASGMEASAVDFVMIGTTHFTNAAVQRRDLAQTVAVRLGLAGHLASNAAADVDWQEDLKQAIGNHAYLAHGGNELDGRVISPLDEEELLKDRTPTSRREEHRHDRHHVRLPSPVSTDFEKRAGEIFERHFQAPILRCPARPAA